MKPEELREKVLKGPMVGRRVTVEILDDPVAIPTKKPFPPDDNNGTTPHWADDDEDYLEPEGLFGLGGIFDGLEKR